MSAFLDQNFLLTNETARILFHEYSENMPIIDYHCHINPQEIAQNKQFDTITQLWLGSDHYKWRLMRANGIEEKYITGSASDKEKFCKWAETLEKAIGNPLYHWSHLELQRYFNFYEPLTGKNAIEVFDYCNLLLKKPEMSANNIILKSNVKVICTTDDPSDTLEWHKLIKENGNASSSVLPAWRPDKAINIEQQDYMDYLKKLSNASKTEITSFASLKEALKKRLLFFQAMGSRLSDHGLNYVMFQPTSEEKIETIFKKRLQGELLKPEEELNFKTALLLFLGREYHSLGWVMQLHYGVRRNNNTLFYQEIGPDTGFDCIRPESSSEQLILFLNELNSTNQLPKTILYSLDPMDNTFIDCVIGCFQDSSFVGKIQHGSAWWFNDHRAGITEHLTSLANFGLLSNFIGMLTDSRSFLSYTRHEYFRRILCNLIGTWVENGEYPKDIDFLGKIVQDISYENCLKYFSF